MKWVLYDAPKFGGVACERAGPYRVWESVITILADMDQKPVRLWNRKQVLLALWFGTVIGVPAVHGFVFALESNDDGSSAMMAAAGLIVAVLFPSIFLADALVQKSVGRRTPYLILVSIALIHGGLFISLAVWFGACLVRAYAV